MTDEEMNLEFKADNGNIDGTSDPIVSLSQQGRGSYLWIGCKAKSDMRCFCTLQNTKSIERLARAILKQLRKRKATKARGKR